jgi:hypothetical protein
VLIEAIRLLTARPGTAKRLVVVESAPELVPALLQLPLVESMVLRQ